MSDEQAGAADHTELSKNAGTGQPVEGVRGSDVGGPYLYPHSIGMTARQRMDRIRLRLLAQRAMRGVIKASKPKGSKYQPHQGARERARRQRQKDRQNHVQQTDEP